jgi:hypothetical protein
MDAERYSPKPQAVIVDSEALDRVQALFSELDTRSRARIGEELGAYQSEVRNEYILDVKEEYDALPVELRTGSLEDFLAKRKVEARVESRLTNKKKILEVSALGLRIEVKLSDDTVLNCSTLSDVKTIPNVSARHITMLKFTNRDQNLSVSLKFLNDDFLESSYQVQGSFEAVTKYSAVCDDIFESMKPWYSPIACFTTTRLLFSALTLMVLFSAVVGSYVFFMDIPVKPSNESSTTSFVFNWATMTIALFVVAWSWSRFRNLVFPKVIFAINGGKQRFEKVKLMQRLTVGAVSSGVLALVTKVYSLL